MRRRRRGCDSCEVLTINGVACHELGCPDRHLDPATREPRKVACDWCGTPCADARWGKAFCDDECAGAYWG